MANINGFGTHSITLMNMMLGKSQGKNSVSAPSAKKSNANASFQISGSMTSDSASITSGSYSVARYDNAPFQSSSMMRLPAYSRETQMYPDTLFFTKSEPAMTDDEFKQAVIALAKEEKEKGIPWGTSAALRELKEQYVSVVSPDRHGISANSDFMIPSNANHFLAKIVDDKTGESVGEYEGGKGWIISYTKAERSRMDEIGMLYYNAYWGNDDAGSGSSSTAGKSELDVNASINVDIKA